jgi:hypothetical protein
VIWLAPVALGSVAIVAGIGATHSTASTAVVAPAVVVAAPAASAIPIAPQAASAPAAPPPQAAPKVVLARSVPPTTAEPALRLDSPELSQELRLLDGAKRALAAGDSAGAAVILDRYAREFPHGRLAQESVAIRIRVLARSGDRERALALYERLAKSDRASPYLEGLRELLGVTEP